MNNSQEPAIRHVKLDLPSQQTSVNEDGTITVHIPISFKKHGGRKYIITPDLAPEVFAKPEVRNSLVKALGQAFYWKKLLDTGQALSLPDIAHKVKSNGGYIGRVMRLTLLAPDIIEAILNGRQPRYLTLREIVLKKFPIEWEEQRILYGFKTPPQA